MTDILAISIRQPWAYAITRLGKDVENRSRRLSHRGPVLIHASAGMKPEEYCDAADFISVFRSPLDLPGPSQLDRGGIVGVAEITGCVSESTSPWWMGPFGLTITAARPVPFIPCRGTIAPLFWRPSPEVADRVRGYL